MTQPFGIREYVRPKIPVIMEPNAPYEGALPPPALTEDPGIEWGKTSFLNFNLELGPQPPIRYPPNVQMFKTEDELIQRWGTGRLDAFDRDGNQIADGRILLAGDDEPLTSLFFVKNFIEHLEETKTFGGVTTVQPIENHVDLFVEWLDISGFGFAITDKHRVQET